MNSIKQYHIPKIGDWKKWWLQGGGLLNHDDRKNKDRIEYYVGNRDV